MVPRHFGSMVPTRSECCAPTTHQSQMSFSPAQCIGYIGFVPIVVSCCVLISVFAFYASRNAQGEIATESQTVAVPGPEDGVGDAVRELQARQAHMISGNSSGDMQLKIAYGGSQGSPMSRHTITILTRTFARDHTRANKVFASAMHNAAVLAGSGVEFVYVLDAEAAGDHDFGRKLVQAVGNLSFCSQPGSCLVRVEFAPLPLQSERMFMGRLEGTAGKDRSQYFNFVADRFSSSDILGFIDAESALIAAPTVSYIASEGRLQHVVEMHLPVGDHWGVDAWALNSSTPLDVMWGSARFPMYFWRKDLAGIRELLVKRFNVGKSYSPFASSFDAAYARITNSQKRFGYRTGTGKHGRHGFSQFNILINAVFQLNPTGYAFHGVPQFSEALSKLRAQYEQAYLTAEPLFSISYNGFNVMAAPEDPGGETVKRAGPWTAYMCCELHADLDCVRPRPKVHLHKSQREVIQQGLFPTLFFEPICGPWPQKCLADFLNVTLSEFKKWSETSQRAHLDGCRWLVRLG